MDLSDNLKAASSAAPAAPAPAATAPAAGGTLDARDTLRRTLVGSDAAPSKGGRPSKEAIAARKAAELETQRAAENYDRQRTLASEGRAAIGRAIVAFQAGDINTVCAEMMGGANAFAEATECKYGTPLAKYPEVGLAVCAGGWYFATRIRANVLLAQTPPPAAPAAPAVAPVPGVISAVNNPDSGKEAGR